MVRSKSGKLTSWGNRDLSHYLRGFSTIPGGDCRISEPSTVRRLPALDLKTTGRSPDVILLTSIVTACGRATEGSHAVDVFEELKRYRIEATVCPGHVGLLAGGFKGFLFSPRNFGKMNPFWRAYFSIGLKPPTRLQQVLLFCWFVVVRSNQTFKTGWAEL